MSAFLILKVSEIKTLSFNIQILSRAAEVKKEHVLPFLRTTGTAYNYLDTPPFKEIFTNLFAFVLHCMLIDELLTHINPFLHWFAIL